MQLSISASGAPSHVNAAVATAIDSERVAHPDLGAAAYPALVALQGYIGTLVGQSGPDDTVMLECAVSIEVTRKAPAIQAPSQPLPVVVPVTRTAAAAPPAPIAPVSPTVPYSTPPVPL